MPNANVVCTELLLLFTWASRGGIGLASASWSKTPRIGDRTLRSIQIEVQNPEIEVQNRGSEAQLKPIDAI